MWESESLNQEELLYTATLYDDLETKLAIYEKASKQDPKSFRAKNNMGYIYVLQGEADKAQSAFEAAKQIEDNDIVNNNLGTVALMQGDVAKAEQLFTASMGAGSVVNYNLGIIKIMQGDYEAAARYFGITDEYNNALVKLLRDDFNGALSTINNVEADFAKKHYLKAVIAANQDKDDLVMESLRMAISKDSKLKERAKVDMEFAEYFENDTFKGLVE
jgi:Tfp pilus assembly protein PilF